MAQIKIMARKNGPFRVDAPEGSVELVDADGQKYDLTGKTNFALCRCGGSVNKPFCDGTHSASVSRPPKPPSAPNIKPKTHRNQKFEPYLPCQQEEAIESSSFRAIAALVHSADHDPKICARWFLMSTTGTT